MIAINVWCNVATPSHPQDAEIEGVYVPEFSIDISGKPADLVARLALDLFHTQVQIASPDEFLIDVMDEYGQRVHAGTTFYRQDGLGTVRKLEEMPSRSFDERALNAQVVDIECIFEGPDGNGQHPKFTRACWQQAVARGDTLCGYWDFVRNCMTCAFLAHEAMPL